MNADPQRLVTLLAVLKPSPWLRDLFEAQRKVAKSKARYKSVTTSRRGGKTILLCALAAEALEASGPDEATVYLARTRGAAKELLWAKLKAIASAHSLPWTFHESELRVETLKGGVLLVRGAEGSDPEEEREKLRGLKLRRALLDEPATYSGTLKILLRDVIEPAIGDLRGDIIVTGTPGLTQAGSWYEISTGKLSKWECHHWTIRDNPFFPDAETYLGNVLTENGWTEDHPTYQREYQGVWSVDESVGVYRFAASRNGIDALPSGYGQDWTHTIGVDFGMVDDCAWAVLASPPHSQDVFVVKAFKRPNLLPEQAALVTQELVQQYRPVVLVGDAGGLGKPYVEAFNRRFGGRMVAAQKSEKLAHIALMNGDFQAGRLKVVMPECEALVEELQTLPWANDNKDKEHPSYANHLCDAALYAARHHRAYLHEPVKVAPSTRMDPDSPEWLEKELSQMNRKWWDA